MVNNGLGLPLHRGPQYRERLKPTQPRAIPSSRTRAGESGGHRGGSAQVSAGCFEPTGYQVARQHPLVATGVRFAFGMTRLGEDR